MPAFMLSKILNIASFWIVEFAVLFGLYLLFASSLDTAELAELYVGLGISAQGATGSEVFRAREEVKFRPRPLWLVYAFSLPWCVVRGTREKFSLFW